MENILICSLDEGKKRVAVGKIEKKDKNEKLKLGYDFKKID